MSYGLPIILTTKPKLYLREIWKGCFLGLFACLCMSACNVRCPGHAMKRLQIWKILGHLTRRCWRVEPFENFYFLNPVLIGSIAFSYTKQWVHLVSQPSELLFQEWQHWKQSQSIPQSLWRGLYGELMSLLPCSIFFKNGLAEPSNPGS
jgi:hypothetical protein